MTLSNKTILLTGGTGSFGNKFCEIALKKYNPKVIRIYSRGELLQINMEKRFSDSRLRFLIGDIRDKDRLLRAMTDVDIVVHAAALKHVPICEYNPFEAVQTNILGAINLVNCALESQVEKVLAISTDKAVHPVNLYGATKMVMEKLLVQANTYTASKTRPIFSCVRYGNVVGSRGSVVPVFMEQVKQGRLKITDERMTRFWITLEQGVQFVIDCLGRMKAGEVFVPKIPSMRVMELADVMGHGLPYDITGIRPGEKLHEVLITEDEARHTKEREKYYIIEPEFTFWTEDKQDGFSLFDGWEYRSDTNTEVLSENELKKEILKIVKTQEER